MSCFVLSFLELEDTYLVPSFTNQLQMEINYCLIFNINFQGFFHRLGFGALAQLCARMNYAVLEWSYGLNGPGQLNIQCAKLNLPVP